MFNFFYNKTLRKLIIAFSDIFNSVKITNSNNNEYTVPIQFTSKSKLMYRYRNPDKRKKKIILPLLTFIIDGQTFDGERQRNKRNLMYKQKTPSGDGYSKMYESTKYNFVFTLSIWAKELTEFFQIIEQITVNFQPYLNASIKLLDEDEDGIEITKDVPIILDSITYNTNFELSEDEDRVLQADITFTMKSELFRKVATSDGNIETMTLNMKNLDYDYTLEQLTID